jgi:hypothetical protein
VPLFLCTRNSIGKVPHLVAVHCVVQYATNTMPQCMLLACSCLLSFSVCFCVLHATRLLVHCLSGFTSPTAQQLGCVHLLTFLFHVVLQHCHL